MDTSTSGGPEGRIKRKGEKEKREPGQRCSTTEQRWQLVSSKRWRKASAPASQSVLRPEEIGASQLDTEDFLKEAGIDWAAKAADDRIEDKD